MSRLDALPHWQSHGLILFLLTFMGFQVRRSPSPQPLNPPPSHAYPVVGTSSSPLRPLPLLLATVLLLAPLLLSPGATASPVTITTFSSGVASANLTFGAHPWNDTLAVELPRGSAVTAASLTATGLIGPSIEFSAVDFSSGRVAADRWAMYDTGTDCYPPSLDPYNDDWTPIAATDVTAAGKDDGTYWYTTTGLALQPPWPYPVQVVQFIPPVTGAPAIDIVWNGYGTCNANETNTFWAELWLYNHTGSSWTMKASYYSNAAGDMWLNATIEAGSEFQATNGSIVAAIAGPHCEVILVPPNPKADPGHLYTDYIAALVYGSGEDELPSRVNMTVGATTMVLAAGDLTRDVTVGDSLGLRAAIQAAVDAEPVMPGNLTVALNVTVAHATMAAVRLSGLSLSYDPPVNAPPEWAGVSSYEVQEDAGWTDVLQLETTFTDDFNQDGLVYSIANVSDPSNLTARINPMPGGVHVLAVASALNFFGEVTVTLAARDLFDATGSSGPIAVRVLQVADRPALDRPSELAATEEEPFEYTFTCMDKDLPDDAITFSDNTDMFDIDPATGRIAWTPTQEQVGPHPVIITATDRFGLADTANVRFTVANLNDRPVIGSALEMDAVQDVAASYQVLVDDPDLLVGDALTFTAYSESIEVTMGASTGILAFTPLNEHYPGFDVTLIVQDRSGASDTRTLRVNVANVNDPPTLMDPGTQRADQWETVALRLLIGDPDLAIALPVAEGLALSSDGPAWLGPDPSGWVNLTADQSMVGEHRVNYTVTDREGLTTTVAVLWLIADLNDVPVVTTEVEATYTVDEDVPFTLLLEAMDLDGDTLTWKDDASLFNIDEDSGNITFTPRQNHVGTHRVTVTVEDGKGGAHSKSFDIVVVNVNDRPVIKTVLPQNASVFAEGVEVRFQGDARDEDGDLLTYTWKLGGKTLGTGATFATKALRPGKHTITLAVSDGNATAERDVLLEVEGGAGGGVSMAVIGAIVLVVVVVLVVVALLALRSRRRAPPEPPKPPEAPPQEPSGKIEIEVREV